MAYKDSFVDREQYLNLVMIYCDGGDIYTKIKNSKGKNFSEQQILDWLVQMALALLYLHERKILHRDMKTQNIFLKNSKVRIQLYLQCHRLGWGISESPKFLIALRTLQTL